MSDKAYEKVKEVFKDYWELLGENPDLTHEEVELLRKQRVENRKKASNV